MLYKQLTKKRIKLDDVKDFDYEFYNSMKWILENDITNVLDLTMSVEESFFGEISTFDLMPNGSEMAVDEQNKLQFVELMIEWKTKKRVEKQLDSIFEGICEIISPELLSIFDEREMELLLCGISEIDIKNWKENTVYKGLNLGDKLVKWFWEIVEFDFDSEQRSKLLKFVTGTSKVPIGGFQELYGSDGPRLFTIERSERTINSLPVAHTCFNRLDVPEYRIKSVFHSKLLVAINETLGFGIK